MTTVERIKRLCKDRHTSVAKMERELGFGNGYIANLRRDTLPYERLVSIAEYLDVSAEYLTKGENEKTPTQEGERQNEFEDKIMSFLRALPKDRLRGILLALEAPADVIAVLDQQE